MAIPHISLKRKLHRHQYTYDDAIMPAATTANNATTSISPPTIATRPSPQSRRSSTPPLDVLSSRRGSATSENLPSFGDSHWHLDKAETEDKETAHLWQSMLALQRRFHCYNSARMNAAIDDWRMEAAVPPRSCLDLLNDSIAVLPDDYKREIEAFLDNLDGARSNSKRHRGLASGHVN